MSCWLVGCRRFAVSCMPRREKYSNSLQPVLHPLQLERLAADKAAQQLQLERDLQQARSEAQQVNRAYHRVTIEG